MRPTTRRYRRRLREAHDDVSFWIAEFSEAGVFLWHYLFTDAS